MFCLCFPLWGPCSISAAFFFYTFIPLVSAGPLTPSTPTQPVFSFFSGFCSGDEMVDHFCLLRHSHFLGAFSIEVLYCLPGFEIFFVWYGHSLSWNLIWWGSRNFLVCLPSFLSFCFPSGMLQICKKQSVAFPVDWWLFMANGFNYCFPLLPLLILMITLFFLSLPCSLVGSSTALSCWTSKWLTLSSRSLFLYFIGLVTVVLRSQNPIVLLYKL